MADSVSVSEVHAYFQVKSVFVVIVVFFLSILVVVSVVAIAVRPRVEVHQINDTSNTWDRQTSPAVFACDNSDPICRTNVRATQPDDMSD